jgi:hypothetical protein
VVGRFLNLHVILRDCPFTGFLAKSDKVMHILVLARKLLAFNMTAKRKEYQPYMSAKGRISALYDSQKKNISPI